MSCRGILLLREKFSFGIGGAADVKVCAAHGIVCQYSKRAMEVSLRAMEVSFWQIGGLNLGYLEQPSVAKEASTPSGLCLTSIDMLNC